MKSQLAKQLKDLLDKMSQEEFDVVWAKVTERDTDSPVFDEYSQFLANSIVNKTVKYKFSEEEDTTVSSSLECIDIDLSSAA